MSQLTTLGEKLKAFADEVEAREAMRERAENVRLIRRGPLEIKLSGEEYVASWEPEAREIEVNGKKVPLRPTVPCKFVATNPYRAAHGLVEILEERKAWG